MALKRFLFAVLFGCCSTAAMAQADDGSCRNGMFGEENGSFGLGTVAASGQTHFVYDMQGCPNATNKCRLPSYVVKGDKVVTGRTIGDYLCVYFPNKGGGTAGWVMSSRISPLPIPKSPPASAWVGSWSDDGNPEVRFYIKRGRLMAHGYAAWPSFNPPLKEFPGGPNVGEIDEAVRTSGNHALAAECNITFTLLGEYMVGADPDRQCGGMNVAFTAVYKRSKR